MGDVVGGVMDSISVEASAIALLCGVMSKIAGFLRLLVLRVGLALEESFFVRLTPRGLESVARPRLDLDPAYPRDCREYPTGREGIRSLNPNRPIRRSRSSLTFRSGRREPGVPDALAVIVI